MECPSAVPRRLLYLSAFSRKTTACHGGKDTCSNPLDIMLLQADPAVNLETVHGAVLEVKREGKSLGKATILAMLIDMHCLGSWALSCCHSSCV